MDHGWLLAVSTFEGEDAGMSEVLGHGEDFFQAGIVGCEVVDYVGGICLFEAGVAAINDGSHDGAGRILVLGLR